MITKRNIILVILTIAFLGFNYIFNSYFINDKIDTIKNLEKKHKDINEKYITAQILSQKLEHVYDVFESNLAFSKKDDLLSESDMNFLKEITDLMQRYEINLSQIIPGKKEKKGNLIYIPYTLEFDCDYNKLGKLIVSLENNDRYITINNIMLRNNVEKLNKSKNDDLSFLNQNIEMKIYTVTLNKAKKL